MPDVTLSPKQKVGKLLGRPIAFYGRGNDVRVRELLDTVELPDHAYTEKRLASVPQMDPPMPG
jgi:ABC-type glutathione transport system ATPase component